MEKLNKVCTNFEQDFTETEKAQARRNIGAQQELIEGSNISIVGNTISAIVPTPEPQPIPPINDAQLTINRNGTTVGTFTANASEPSVVDITVPTKTSDITNDSGFITSADLPTVGNGQITIQKNGSTVDSFKVNQSSAKTINITVPTKTSEITNDSGFITSSSLPTVNDATLTIQKNGTTVGTFTANASVDKTIDLGVPPDNIFVAEYNVSTWAQVKAAYDAGKAIILVGANFGTNIHTQMALYNYSTTSGQTEKFMFAPTAYKISAAQSTYWAQLDETAGWTSGYRTDDFPNVNSGVLLLSGNEQYTTLVEHRGWLCNQVGFFKIGFMSSFNACTVYLEYVDTPLTFDIIGLKRTIRNDLKSQIDSSTTVQTLVTAIDVQSRVVETGATVNSSTTRYTLFTMGPQEQSSLDTDIHYDVKLLDTANQRGFDLHVEKFGVPSSGHCYICATLAGGDLF